MFDPLRTYDERPLVSVIIRTYEGDRHLLPRACASVAAQDIDPKLVEVWIAHDGPPVDGEEFGKNPAEFGGLQCVYRTIWPSRKFGYYCASSNQAILYASGLYIAHLDADNEWTPDHLRLHLQSMRTPIGKEGFPHFTYSRIKYVKDDGVDDPKLPEGCGPAVQWTPEALKRLAASPMNNFIDSSSFMISRSRMILLANQTGTMWNQEVRRFGDWELIYRLTATGAWGKALEEPTLIYHWTGKNIQTSRRPEEPDLVPVPEEMYDELVKAGRIKPPSYAGLAESADGGGASPEGPGEP